MPYSNLRKGRYSEPGREYLVTIVTHLREQWFKDFYSTRLMVKEMQRLEREGSVTWLAWVVMPDHFHALLSLDGRVSLSEAMNKLKGRSARVINQLLDRTGPFWQSSFYDHALRREEDRLQPARYVVANPLRAGIVERLGDYPHWDSVWLPLSP
jgi:REP element-mobilizing transposase RayT